MTDAYLDISHYENCLEEKQGWLVRHGDDFTGSVYYVEDPNDARYEGLGFAEWPRSLWGYFETKKQAENAVVAAGLARKLRTEENGK
jgi:hypothetical protein